MLRLALLVLALAPAWSGTDNLALTTAEKQLRSGLVRQAGDGFRHHLEAHPNSGRAKIGLASALSMLGQCEGALALLDELRSRRAWGASAALAEGSCRRRAGDVAGAYVAYEEALWFSPKDPGAWTALAMVALGVGDHDMVEHAVDELSLLRRGEILGAVLAAQVSYAEGDPDLDVRLEELRRLVEGSTEAHVQLLDGLRWLDLDDPRAADDVLLRAVRRDMNNIQLAAWRAESARRLGDTHDARGALERPLVRRGLDTPLGIAIESRLLVDEGDLAAAKALLATHPDASDAEALASAWYIARREADYAAADRLAALWRQVELVPGRRLEHLVPVNQRKTQ